MEKQLKENWINHLSSGEYAQAKESLKKSYGYCCLGVLACACLNLKVLPGDRIEGDPVATDKNGNGYPALFPYLSKEQQIELIKLNDEDGYSFREIIDWIKINIKE